MTNQIKENFPENEFPKKKTGLFKTFWFVFVLGNVLIGPFFHLVKKNFGATALLQMVSFHFIAPFIILSYLCFSIAFLYIKNIREGVLKENVAQIFLVIYVFLCVLTFYLVGSFSPLGSIGMFLYRVATS
jgi:hypothetical protein